MTNNDRYCPANCGTTLNRLYIRKVQQGGPDNKHMQRYVTWGWLCLLCGLIMIDPPKCKKCESANIEAPKFRWIEEIGKWACLDCKHSWTPKLEKKSQKLIILT